MTTGIGNEWDPGDPPEIHKEGRRGPQMTLIEPVEFFAELGDILTQTVGSPFRKEPLTADELDTIADRILMFAQQLKGVQDVNRS